MVYDQYIARFAKNKSSNSKYPSNDKEGLLVCIDSEVSSSDGLAISTIVSD